MLLRRRSMDQITQTQKIGHSPGVQYTFWAMMKDAPREHMQKAFIQRREQIVGDCVQLNTDVEAYNGFNDDQQPIQMLFDFRDDIEERKFSISDAA